MQLRPHIIGVVTLVNSSFKVLLVVVAAEWSKLGIVGCTAKDWIRM